MLCLERPVHADHGVDALVCAVALDECALGCFVVHEREVRVVQPLSEGYSGKDLCPCFREV